MIEHGLEVYRQDAEEKRYRAYLTDALMVIAENTAHIISGGKVMNGRWLEPLKPVQKERTGDEIAADVIRRAGLHPRQPKEVN